MSGSQRQYVREGSKVGEGEERGLRWGRAASCQPPQKERRGGLKAGGGVSQASSALLYPGECSAGPSALARGCPRRLSVAFTLLLIHIYLFIDFYEVSLPSNPSCLCCPDHPHPQPSSCLCSCLSVCHKENKNGKQQDLCVLSMGRDGWGYRVYTMLGYWDRAFQPFRGQ